MQGFTNEQVFFIGYALTWCEVDTPEYLRQLVQSNPHSPAIARVNVVVGQAPSFAQAFKCAPNTPMNPSQRCDVW
jgi:putative endopeptidase